MATKHEVELFISEDGELKIHVKGIKGAGCVKVLDSLVKEMGTEIKRELTPEYYESSESNNISNAKLKKNKPL
jgi:hypothetical protein